jgi:hypothetical protein
VEKELQQPTATTSFVWCLCQFLPMSFSDMFCLFAINSWSRCWLLCHQTEANTYLLSMEPTIADELMQVHFTGECLFREGAQE